MEGDFSGNIEIIFCLSKVIYWVWWFLPDETTYQLLRLFEEWERERLFLERERNKAFQREREIVTAIEMGSHSHQQNHYCYYYHFNHCVWSISATKSFSSSSSSGITLTLTAFLFPLCPFPHCHQSALNPDETFLHLCRSSTFPWL